MPILDNETDDDIKIQKAIELVSNKGNIFLDIDKISDINEKKAVLDKLNFEDYSFDRNKLLNEIILRLHIGDNEGNSADTVSMLDIRLENKVCRISCLSEENEEQYNYTDFISIISKIYLLNELYKFAINNQKVIEDYLFASPMLRTSIKLLEEDVFNISNNFNRGKDNIYFTYFNGYSYDNIDLVLKYIKRENKKIISETKLKYKGYALTYETKRNIPTKTIEKMKDNKFLNWFGYVEIDENCDLNIIAQLEDEFEDYMKQINLVTKGKEHSLRFKKLGKQKAGGLYYANEKAVCIDIKQPSSCTHEIFHMIDHMTIKDKELSELDTFKAIEGEYIKLVTEEINNLDKEDKIRKKFYGRSKYNRYYYFEPAEVFARCGELYISEILKLSNSLINKEDGVYYPKNKEFLKLVKTYYGNMLRGIRRGLYE